MAKSAVSRKLAALTACAWTAACGSGKPPSEPVPLTPEPAPAATLGAPRDDKREPGDPPSADEPEIDPAPQHAWNTTEPLEVPGFLDALVSLPSSQRRCDRLLFVAHGAGGGPEAHCAQWRAQLGDRGLIVCSRGALINQRIGPAGGYYYPDHFALKKETLAVVTALEQAYQSILPPKPWTYAGYSQGATMGALMLPPHGGLFSRVILVEGGFSSWSPASANEFKASGGERVAIVCGRSGPARAAKRSARLLENAGIEVRALHAPGAGHTYLGGVAQRVTEVLPWVWGG